MVTITFPSWMVYVMVFFWCLKWTMEARLSWWKYKIEQEKRALK